MCSCCTEWSTAEFSEGSSGTRDWCHCCELEGERGQRRGVLHPNDETQQRLSFCDEAPVTVPCAITILFAVYNYHFTTCHQRLSKRAGHGL